MCEFRDSNCNGFGDMWWTDKCINFSSRPYRYRTVGLLSRGLLKKDFVALSRFRVRMTEYHGEYMLHDHNAHDRKENKNTLQRTPNI